MVRESLPPNPNFSLGRVAGPLSSEIEGAIAADILALATLPARADIAADHFEAARLEAAEATLSVAMEARRAYYRAVGARELVRVMEQAEAAAATAAKLSRQLGETGAMPKLDQARDQLFHAEIAAKLASARQKASSERERLVRALGLWGADLSFVLPDALPSSAGANSRHAQGRTGGGRTPHRSPNRPKETRCARQVARTRRVDALCRSFPAIGAGFDHAGKRQWRQGHVQHRRRRRGDRNPDLRPWRNARPRIRAALARGCKSSGPEGRRGSIGGARSLSRLSRNSRDRQPSSARNHAVARHHQRRNPAALQHDDRRRVRPARGCATPRRRDRRGGRGQAGFLARRRRSARRCRGRRRGALEGRQALSPFIAETGAERP